MARNLRLFAIPAVLVVVVLIVLWRGCRWDGDRSPATPGDFAVDGITLTSPDLDLALLSVRTTASPGYTEWACLFECRERGGCRADVRMRILYRTGGRKNTLNLSGRLDAGRGETLRIGRVQRPPIEVERVDEVIVEVVAPYSPDAPRPTPIQ